jgi:hypothetical protein
MKIRRLLAALLLCVATVHPALAEVRGMVTRVSGEEISINIGQQKNAQPGMQLYVYDSMGKPVATVRVVEVDDYASRVQILGLEPRSSLSVGNTVTDTAFTPTPPGSAPATAATPSATPSSEGTPPAKAVDPVKNFEAVLTAHTQMYSFKGGKGGAIKVDLGDVLNIVSSVGIGNGSIGISNPWLITTTAFETYERYSHSARVNQKARSTIEVVYWDEALTNAYADYYVYKETYLDAAKKEEVRQSLLAQKGVQSSAVFQVRIRNRGPGLLQLAPFDWHVYLLDAEGNRIKAERYDEILDKALNAGQEVQGYVYFPKRDPLGRSYVGEPVQLLIEDIFGERTTVKWELNKKQN